jgi:DNA-binding transcriptional ArsR family regulator
LPNHRQSGLSPIFQSLADPTRRAVVERLSHGPAPVTELAKAFSMALPSFLQHLRVLEDSGLVRSTKTGRVRTCRLNPHRLRQAESWLEKQRAHWTRRLNQLDAYLITLQEKS